MADHDARIRDLEAAIADAASIAADTSRPDAERKAAIRAEVVARLEAADLRAQVRDPRNG